MTEKWSPQPLNYHGQNHFAEDPELKRWRYRRILFRASLFVFLSPVVFYFGRNLFLFGKLTPLSASDFVPLVQNAGVPIVRAIKLYQRDSGHLPDDVKDLVPRYLASVPAGMPDVLNGRLRLFFLRGPMYEIDYDFTPSTEGWVIRGAFVNGPLPLPPVRIAPATPLVPVTQ